VAEDGTYSSPIENPNRRFFTMLGTLIRGRVTVGGSAGAAAHVALDIATRYALERRQFKAPDDDHEVLLMDYLAHQRRLFPLIARSYALQFAQNELVAKTHDLQTADDPDPEEQRELESRAAGLKAANTWHASRAIQEAREACGGAGYLAENRLIALRADTDVFTTFEGDNHVLLQLVAKGLLTDYASDFEDLDQLGMVRFVAGQALETVVERTAAHTLLERIKDADLRDPDYQLAMFRFREEHTLSGVARRLKRGIDEGLVPGEVFSRAQDHVLAAARAHVERLVLEAFREKVQSMPDGANRDALRLLCDLYALSTIEADRAWFLEHGRLSASRSKALTREVAELCRQIRPLAVALVDAYAVPPEVLRSPDLLGEPS
jgi:acyl-CoA oxidase